MAGDKFDSQIMWDKVAHYFGRYARCRTLGKDGWVNIPRSIISTLCQWHRIPLLRARQTREHIRLIKGTTDDRPALEHLKNIIDDNYGFFSLSGDRAGQVRAFRSGAVRDPLYGAGPEHQ